MRERPTPEDALLKKDASEFVRAISPMPRVPCGTSVSRVVEGDVARMFFEDPLDLTDRKEEKAPCRLVFSCCRAEGDGVRLSASAC